MTLSVADLRRTDARDRTMYEVPLSRLQELTSDIKRLGDENERLRKALCKISTACRRDKNTRAEEAEACIADIRSLMVTLHGEALEALKQAVARIRARHHDEREADLAQARAEEAEACAKIARGFIRGYTSDGIVQQILRAIRARHERKT